MAAELDEKLSAFRERRLDHTGCEYLMLDARYEKIRVGGRVISQAVLVTVGLKRLKKRTKVVGVFPNRASSDRLIGSQLLELHEQWQTEPKAYVNMEYAGA